VERITIIGMGPIGASMGLAIRRAQLGNTEVIGTSRDRSALSTASQMGAVDDAVGSLRAAINGARLVILDTPLRDTRELLEAIGPVLDDGCVVTDTATSKAQVMEWAEQHLPDGISFVGGHPLTKERPRNLSEADASLFEGMTYCVIPARSADPQSVKTVVGLVETLGAKPLFIDAYEQDSYAAAMTYLPMVLSSAFVTTTTGSDVWREMHRLATSEFGHMSSMASNDPMDNQAACLASPDALVHWLDQMITELHTYRDLIEERSDELLDVFIRAWEAKARWEAGAVIEDNQPRLPSAGESMARVFIGERLTRRYRQFTDSDSKKKSSWRYFRKR